MNKVIPHPSLGDILYKKNRRSKRITIRVKEGGKVQVTLPTSLPFQQAIQVVNQHTAWISQQLEKASQQQLQRTLDWDSHFSILEKKLQLKAHTGQYLTMQETAETIFLLVPQDWKIQAPSSQEGIKKGLIETLRIFAKRYLPQRTHYWAKLHQININKVFIKNVKTRWGSCSNKGNINLSVHLMLLPPTWIDYVICHELAHIAHPNHSPAFWAHLEELLPGARSIDKALNQYQRPF